MYGTITEKELIQFLKAIRNGKKNKKLLRFHIYASIDLLPGDSASLDDVLQYIQGYGSAEVIYVEAVDGENG